ncbi:S8 family peptidase [Deinococcus aerophilus]|uniref:Serine protease n=1 Tax=Deinococcus aerophilus TaxID=522488 RepID=A0ABQ2GP85_9DEIO|nr:S8 family serine peptidase [Deinococcus aerophilus]GGM04549.1 serine protease [Deinococcus aerophilus]
MARRLLLSALTLPLLLSACMDQMAPPEQPRPPTPPPIIDPPACSTAPTGLGVAGVRAQVVRAARVGAQGWNAPHVPGEVLIVSAGGKVLGAQALRALAGVQVTEVGPGTRLARTPAGEGDQAFAARLQAAGVRTQPNFVYAALAVPNDPGVPGNAGISIGTLKVNQTYLTRVHAQDAWNVLAGLGKTPLGAATAVLDSGQDTTHPELQGRLSAQASFLDGCPDTTSGHGTATAGLIGAKTNNGVGVAGMVWGGPLIGVEVLGEDGATTLSVAQGLDYAVKQGAKVINISLGSPGNPGDTALDAALASAAKSAVIVAAAGNTAAEGVYYPASHPDVLAVGAVGAKDSELACYSARSSTKLPRALDLVAPGGAGFGACPGATREQDLPVLLAGGGYGLEAGTSFSAPLVSGVAALMRGANPSLTADQTRALLLDSADRSGGLPLLNAEAAVRAAVKASGQ